MFEYFCAICSQSFESFATGKSHLILSHPNEKFENALVAKKLRKKEGKREETPTESEFSHRKSHISQLSTQKTQAELMKYLEQVRPNGEKRFSCPECFRSFAEKRNLKYHLQVHYKILPYKCSICTKGFITPSILKSHMESHKTVKDYECEICSKKFRAKSTLYSHKQRIHEKQKTFIRSKDSNDPEAEIADYCKNAKRNEKGRYPCNKCEANLLSRYSLKVHMRLHYNIRPHQCDSCSNSYGTLTHLNRHKKRHQTQKINPKQGSMDEEKMKNNFGILPLNIQEVNLSESDSNQSNEEAKMN